MARSGQSRAQANKAIRAKALREQLASQGHLQHIIDIHSKLLSLEDDLDAVEVQRLRAVMDSKHKLIDKYLPTLKSTELTTDDDNPLSITLTVVEN